MIIWIVFSFMTANTWPYLWWNVDTYGIISYLYYIQLCIWLIFCLVDIHDHQAQSWVSSKGYMLFVLLYCNSYISNLYILDQNSKLTSHMTCVLYLGYISLLLVCDNFPLTLKKVICWDLLESYPARITFIDSSHKWNQILFIILYSKLGICIFSHCTIDVNSQSNFYGVKTLYHTRLFPELHLLWIPDTLQTTYLENIIDLVPPLSSILVLHYSCILHSFFFVNNICVTPTQFTWKRINYTMTLMVWVVCM